MIRILLVDDHPAVMEGTRSILEQEGDMKVFLADSAGRALEMAGESAYDVMLFDLHLADSNGIDLAKQVLKLRPDAVILIYTGFEFNNHFNLMIESGISGFILKTSNGEQLVTAVRCALRGEVVLPLSLVRQLRRTSLQAVEPGSRDAANLAISSKEYEILREIARGKSNKEIAELSLMSQRSLEYVLTNLFNKLGVKSRIEAAMKAKQLGFLTDADLLP
ncbi:DNA-binding response regulator [Cohnella sp. CIP 111063]|jgi:two-component system competent response regulator ComA|uniref:response regulator transcription factor n=1 Tax=unclassified Cohnella TaxID=2636738 RepID=UPI000B8C69B9|nr:MULTISPECIES: response regulator transcription factor [unclassified Cohnella]OXS57585.1 DNA-binding response regulator [Cohnella sp. CIP 111063]PRX70963.1 LuxR family two component transcriptional regulator [Cohnella sp. SGD-V74]